MTLDTSSTTATARTLSPILRLCLTVNRLLFLNHQQRTYDEIAVVMTAIIKVRNQWFPFLWHDANWNRRDLMDTARGTAAIILLSDIYPTQRALYNAVKRALYHEARSWGWRRERSSQNFTPPPPSIDLDGDDKTIYTSSNSAS